MGYYIDISGNYYEGDRIDWRDTEVVQRPNGDFVMVDGIWTLDMQRVRARMFCSRLQALEALRLSGMLTSTEARFVNATPQKKLAWDNAQEFYRLNPLLVDDAAEAGITDAQLDELFTLAMSLYKS